VKPTSAPPGWDLPVWHVQSERDLRVLCERLGVLPRFGIDTEFVGERSYVPRLELIQVATPAEVALIDCRVVTDLAPLFPLIENPHVEKVLHAAQQDLELFTQVGGCTARGVFDTQVAAAMAGYGAQCGFAHLLERVLGVGLEKTETLTDWSRRPLTPAQLAYAADDVRYLLTLRDRLADRLATLGRTRWLDEELRRLEDSIGVRPADAREAYRRVRGRGALRPRGLAILRELAAWREETARARDRPRGALLKDEALVEIARRAPRNAAALQAPRGIRFQLSEGDRHEIVRRVEVALALPESEWPESESRPTRPIPSGVVELLQAVLRTRAEEAGIASLLLASSADLGTLVRDRLAGRTSSIPLLRGWRRELLGEVLVELLEGRSVVSLDPTRCRLRVEPRSGRSD
jgi:ribonuclease D